MRVLIVDDEPLARLRLAQLVVACGADNGAAACVAGQAADAASALQWLRSHEADVVLLDVQMPGPDGISLAGAIAALQRPPAVIFVTAHPQRAIEAFELEAVDYLAKPVRLERLGQALERARRRLSSRRLEGAAPGAASASAAAEEPALLVNERGRVQRIPLSRVVYLRAGQKYVTLRTEDHAHLLDESLADLERRLGERFLRIHRNALVARSAVDRLELRGTDDDGAEGWAVRVRPTGEWLAVSRRQLAAVREALGADAL